MSTNDATSNSSTSNCINEINSTNNVDQDTLNIVNNLQKAIANVVRASNALPKICDGFELYYSYPDYAKFMEQQKLRVILAMRKLLASINCRVKITAMGLEDMEKIILANDRLIERIGISLDEHQMFLTQQIIVKSKLDTKAEPIKEIMITPGSKSMGVKDGGGRYSIAFGKSYETTSNSIPMLFSSNIAKPQKAFQDSIINTDSLFKPKLVIKHNSIKTVKNNLKIHDQNCGKNNETYNAIDNQNFEETLDLHPYQNEINYFEILQEELIAPKIINKTSNVENTLLVFVETVEKLQNMISELNKLKRFAVDLEHHSYRSFLGLTCLIQISTDKKDFIIDPFPIWKNMYLLNEPFSNPKIIKVFHGAQSDVLWLQRDFGIYTINIFDTSIAMRELGMSRYGLKQLVQEYCGVLLNKDFQKADWRVRPLPNPFIYYARSDTRYLLFCYDQLRLNLAQKEHGTNYEDKKCQSIENVYLASLKLSSKLYEQPKFDPDGYLKILLHRRFNNRQEFALKQIWKWRDATAREHDESLHYVLPEHMMLQIAEVLPREMQGIIACCSPVPPLLKQDIAKIFRYITAARELPLNNSSSNKLTLEKFANQVNTGSNLINPIFNENKITKSKAKLEFNFDCSNFKADEEIPSAIDRISILKRKATFVEEKDEKNEPFLLVMEFLKNQKFNLYDQNYIKKLCVNLENNKKKTLCTYIIDNDDEKNQEKLRKKVEKVNENVNHWVTPYECYLTYCAKTHEKPISEEKFLNE